MTQEAAKKERVAKVIEVLNKARSMELYAVHQYMNQHYNLDDLDYGEFASKIKLIAIDEMRHAEQFAERIKELGGEPNSELSSKITKGQKVMDVFPFNVKVEDDTIETYNKLLEICRTNGDSVSARLFERILDEEQVHDNYFCNMANHIETLGNTYLSKIAGSDSPEIPSRGFRRGGKETEPGIRQPVCCCAGPVDGGANRVSGFEKIGGHRFAHGAQSEKGNGLFHDVCSFVWFVG